MRKTTPGRELRALNGKKRLWVIKEKKNDYGSCSQGFKCKRKDSRSLMRKKTLGHEHRALNQKEITLGYK